jgi:polar amino acid transport system substrate-binding protein
VWTSLLYAAEERTVRIVSDPWCPYQCLDEGDFRGITYDIISEIFGPRGYTVKMEMTSWTRAISALRTGKSTTFASAAKADAPDLIYAEVPTTYMQNTVFQKINSPIRYENVSQFSKGVMGYIQSYTYGSVIDSYLSNPKGPTYKITGPNSLDRLLKMLHHGHIDYFVDDHVVTEYRIKHLNFGTSIQAVRTITSVPLYLGFSPVDPMGRTYAKWASQWLRQAQQDGRLKAIFSKYGIPCLTCR